MPVVADWNEGWFAVCFYAAYQVRPIHTRIRHAYTIGTLRVSRSPSAYVARTWPHAGRSTRVLAPLRVALCADVGRACSMRCRVRARLRCRRSGAGCIASTSSLLSTPSPRCPHPNTHPHPAHRDPHPSARRRTLSHPGDDAKELAGSVHLWRFSRLTRQAGPERRVPS